MKKIILLTLCFFNIHAQDTLTIFSSDSKYLVITTENVANVYSMQRIEATKDLMKITNKLHPAYTYNHGSKITSASFSPDGKYLVTTSLKESKVWEFPRSFCIAKL